MPVRGRCGTDPAWTEGRVYRGLEAPVGEVGRGCSNVDGVLSAEDSDAVAMDDARAGLSGQPRACPTLYDQVIRHSPCRMAPGRARPDIAPTAEDFADLGLYAAGHRPVLPSVTIGADLAFITMCSVTGSADRLLAEEPGTVGCTRRGWEISAPSQSRPICGQASDRRRAGSYDAGGQPSARDTRQGRRPAANAAFPERQEGVADLRRVQVLFASRALTVHATVSALEQVLIRNE
jgi:hypothetical protein